MVTPSKLRENIYRILDRVVETGQTGEVKYKGKNGSRRATEAILKGWL